MKRRTALQLLAAPLAAAYRSALPGYQYAFPRDHFAHPEFQTEWWYWTGNLRSDRGERFGYELTFFRHNVHPARGSAWDVSDVYLAHLAFTDAASRTFFHTERVNREGPGLAGVSLDQRRIWNGNWSASLQDASQTLSAVASDLRLQLNLTPTKPHVVHGLNGVSQKAQGEGKASHYISFTRLQTSGEVTVQGRPLRLSGTSWMDHEFFTNQLGDTQAGWDWFCIQLESGDELMLYRLRLKDGSGDTYSSGTYIGANGTTRHLTSSDFRLTPGPSWISSKTKAAYPIRWRIEIPSLALDLNAQPVLEGQELVSNRSVSPSYWEGAMDYQGTRSGQPIKAVGYLELTGYDRPFVFVQTPKTP